jgi:hypothetical protein
MTVAALESGVTGERKAADLKNFMTDFRVIFDGVCRPMKGVRQYTGLDARITPGRGPTHAEAQRQARAPGKARHHS